MEANGLTTDDYVSVETQARYFTNISYCQSGEFDNWWPRLPNRGLVWQLRG